MSTVSELCEQLVETRKSEPYNLIYRLVCLVLTLPVSTATTERVFSNMKLVKTDLRNKMDGDFFRDTMLINIEREFAEEIDPNDVIKGCCVSGIEQVLLKKDVLQKKNMDSMRGQGGIQMLLSAEEEAQQIVAAARNLKLSRLKQAKDEAAKESSDYRKHMESQYQKILSETSGNSGFTVKRLEEETETKMKSLKECGSKIQPDVVAMIMKYVTTV